MEKRLQKILSEMGMASRRKAEELILEGRITVNGQVATLRMKADPGRDHLKLDGKLLFRPEPKVYIMFNKPKSVVTTLYDPEGRPAVKDFFKKVKYRVFPVGRLDYDSEGLLLLTNDGDFAQSLLHPSKKIFKTYLVKVKGDAPERVAAGSQIAREHPDFVFGGTNGGLFKLNEPEARRWLTDLLSKRITEFGLDVYRNDFNIDPLDFWRRADTADRQGITEIRYVEGHYALWDELSARHPGLWIDNCASGGRRIDLETLMRSVPLWRSDTGCGPGHADWDQVQALGLSQYVPLFTACRVGPDSLYVAQCGYGWRDHGSNRTGRMFTGDSSGDFLYLALYKKSFASSPVSRHCDDGLTLTDVYITAVCRCAPPDNKPTSKEIATCLPYLVREINMLERLQGIVALGRIAFDIVLQYYRGVRIIEPDLRFSHAAFNSLGPGLPWVLASPPQPAEHANWTPD